MVTKAYLCGDFLANSWFWRLKKKKGLISEDKEMLTSEG